ncbi:MAG: BatA domain-containing protein [Kiritimatiellae bacterium]|nr:BatA domain-containing protein [Kiritimatiellia bacterium]MDD5522454.1 BatA domain-containing protein [Kiritimatiellia bacterium]
MNFLNIILLGGIVAASIPLIIHLFHKSHFQIIRWGAMHLLESLQRTQKRRLRLEQLLLLLVRCLIPAILALCMARPVLTGMRTLLGAAKTSVVVVLDNSYSMEVGAAERTTFVQARDSAGRIIHDLARGSELSVILMGGLPRPLLDEPTFNTERATRELGKLQTGYGAADVPASLEMAVSTLGKMHEAHREMIVLSDFQKISWAESEDVERARVANLIKNMPVKPLVMFIHTGQEDKNNVSVQSLDFSRFLLGVNQPFQVRAHLKNHGSSRYSSMRVFFRVDGTEKSVAQIELGPNESGQVLFTHTFDKAGSHVISVDTDVPDALKSDNVLLAAVPVWDKLPVLLVNGNPGRGPLEGETDFLEIALQPYNATKGSLADLITTRVVDQHHVDAHTVKDVRVVILANVQQLQDHQIKALEDFVRGGGGLMIFPGNRIDISWYNSRLSADGKGLLPRKFSTIEGGPEDNDPHAAILGQHQEHPAFQLFNDPRNGDLSTATIRLWYKLVEKQGTAKTNSGEFVMARLNTGDPFMIEKKYGEGSVIICSTPCSADWSNLPLRPFYLPLMQQLVTYLAAKFDPPRNIQVGLPLIAALPAALDGKTMELTDPGGKKHKLTAKNQGGRALLNFDDTRIPGLYLLELPDKSLIHFVVNTSRSESNLAQLTADEIKTAAKPFEATVVKSMDEYRQMEQRRRYGREIWRPLLWALLGLIFVELLLEQRVGGIKR